MKTKGHISILLVEDNEDDALLIARSISRAGYDLKWARVDTPEGMEKAFENDHWDIILVDYRMPRFSGLDALRIVNDRDPNIPVILVSGVIHEETVIEAMREGARDCVKKDNLARLIPSVEREINAAGERRERLQAEKALRESEAFLNMLLNAIPIPVYYKDREGRFLGINKSFEVFFGENIDHLLGKTVFDIVSPELAAIYQASDTELFKNGVTQRYESQVSNAQGVLRDVICNKAIFTDREGAVCGVIGTILDITENKRNEELLRDSLAEKMVLLKEVHHRVKNNMQIISTLLDLQSEGIRDEDALRAFKESQDRIKAMALIHERLYESSDIASIDFNMYIGDLSAHLFGTYLIEPGRIALKMDVGEVSLGIDRAIPCGLIVNELVTNALKHAFPDNRAGEISIGFHRGEDGFVTLRVADNGVGLPPGFNITNTGTLGLQMVTMLVRQLRGELNQERENGTAFVVRFSEQDTK